MEDCAHTYFRTIAQLPGGFGFKQEREPEREKAAMDEGKRERGDLVLTEGIRNSCTYSYQRYDDFSPTIASTERG